MTATAVDVRDKLVLAFDVDDLIEARRLGAELQPYFGVAKVGLELFTAVGPDIVGVLADQGYKVFVDLLLRHSDHRWKSCSRCRFARCFVHDSSRIWWNCNASRGC